MYHNAHAWSAALSTDVQGSKYDLQKQRIILALVNHGYQMLFSLGKQCS